MPGHALDNTGAEPVLQHTESGAFYSFGQTGAYIWFLLETPRTVDELCVELCKEFDVPPDVCHQHVTEFITDLLTIGLVTLSTAEAAPLTVTDPS